MDTRQIQLHLHFACNDLWKITPTEEKRSLELHFKDDFFESIYFIHWRPEWSRTLIFSALNRLSSYCCGFEPSSTSQVLLGGGQVVFLRDLPFLPLLTIDSTQNEWNNPDGPENPNKNKQTNISLKFIMYIEPHEHEVCFTNVIISQCLRKTDKEGIWDKWRISLVSSP